MLMSFKSSLEKHCTNVFIHLFTVGIGTNQIKLFVVENVSSVVVGKLSKMEDILH